MFTRDYGAKWPKAVAKITDDAEELLCSFDFPAKHWQHLKTSNPIESTFASVRLRTRVTKGPGRRGVRHLVPVAGHRGHGAGERPNANCLLPGSAGR